MGDKGGRGSGMKEGDEEGKSAKVRSMEERKQEEKRKAERGSGME